MKNLIAILMILSISMPVLANGRHYSPPPEPTPVPQNVPDDGSNHNAVYMAVFIGVMACVWFECWKSKPMPIEKSSSSVPEIPENEYLRVRSK